MIQYIVLSDRTHMVKVRSTRAMKGGALGGGGITTAESAVNPKSTTNTSMKQTTRWTAALRTQRPPSNGKRRPSQRMTGVAAAQNQACGIWRAIGFHQVSATGE